MLGAAIFVAMHGVADAADCPDDTTLIEVEPNCGLPVDTVNGGCATTPALFSETASGDVICGTLGKVGIVGDSDWYRFSVETASVVSCELECQAPCFLAIMSNGGSPRCNPAPTPIIFAYGDATKPIQLAFDSLRPGSHFLVVSTSLEEVACGTPYVLRWNAKPIPPAPNDACEDALRIESLPAVMPGHTFGANEEPGLPDCPDGPMAPGVWYVVRGNGSNYVVNTCGAQEINYNHRISLYKGSCDALECVALDTHAAVCAAYVYTPEVRWCTEPGVDYYILWNGEGGRTGRFEVNIWDDGPAACEPLGACCVGEWCGLMTSEACVLASGEYQGDGSICGTQNDPSGERVYASHVPAPAIDGVCPAGAVAPILVPDVFTIAHARVRVQLSKQADLSAVNLRLVRGDTVILLHRYACPDTYGMDVEFSDDAPLLDCKGSAGGVWRPQSPLRVLNGREAQGEWSLQLCDADAFGQSTIESWQLLLTPGQSRCNGCAGDANTDGLVTGADLSMLLENFGSEDAGASGCDFNGDGAVNAADLSVLLSNFGTAC